MRRFYKLADRNGDGKITGVEMLKFSRDNFGKYVDLVKVSRALHSADKNRNGKLSFYGKHKYLMVLVDNNLLFRFCFIIHTL